MSHKLPYWRLFFYYFFVELLTPETTVRQAASVALMDWRGRRRGGTT